MTAITRRRGLAAVATLALLIPALTACGGTGPGSGALALVVGGRNNMPRPTLVPKARAKLRAAFDRRDTLIIVGVAGQPRVRWTQPIASDCDTTTACDAAFGGFATSVDQLLSRVQAQTAEADTLGAILIGARALQGYSGTKQMVVVDNGLQTTGAMPLQYPGALMVDPAALVAPWLKDGRLKDLNNVDMLLTGLGDTEAPQGSVPNDLRRTLETLWSTVLTSGHASVDVDSTDLGDVAPATGLPAVTPVNFKPDPPHVPGCFRIREDQIGFLGGKAEFRDEVTARKVLIPVAAELRNTGVPSWVIGTTALDDGPDHGLSTRRARTVVGVLKKLHVPAKQLTPSGVGVHFAGFVPDTDASGHLVETIAVQNRLVIIQPAGQQC
jgi:hypothetical protein